MICRNAGEPSTIGEWPILVTSSLELLSSLRAAAVGGVGRCSEGSAKELRVVQETAIEATYFPPHSWRGERDTTGLNGKRILKRPRQPKLADELLPTTYSQPVALDSCSPQLSSSPVNNAATELWHLGAIKCLQLELIGAGASSVEK